MEVHQIPQEMFSTLPLFFKLKELFEYNVRHMYWNAEELSEEQARILNHYRLRLENDYPSIHLNYDQLLNSIKANIS